MKRRGGRRWRRLRGALGELSGRSARDGIFAIAEQIQVAVAAADVARVMVKGGLHSAQARSTMADVEHEGDAHRAELVGALGAALSTPVDREDLYRLSRSVDDVVDNLRDYVRETDLYEPESQPGAAEMLAAVGDGMRSLLAGVRSIIPAPGQVVEHTIETRKACNRVRGIYQVQVAELFTEPLSNETLKRRELLRRLDVVALRMGEAADALNDGMLKRSM